MIRRLIVLAAVMTLFMAGSGGAQGLPDLAGVYKGERVELTLAGHPQSRSEYIGYIVYTEGHKVLPMKIACDSVKGCHGLIYDSSIADQKAVELKITGDSLSFRYYNGPTLVLKREKQR
ncbi:MAG: hypothetical protein AB9866_25535 [Syntrophobacteraceae bacterium]